MRLDPHDRLPGRADASVEPQAAVPIAPSAQALVAPRQLNVLRARYVIGDVLALRGTNGSSACWTTRVGTRIVGRTARTSNSVTSGNMRATVPGLAARRSCRAHAARISSFHGMSGFITCWNSPVPHMATMAARTSSVGPLGAFSQRIRVALEHDQRGGAGRMCCCEQRRCRERAVDRERGPLRDSRDRRAPR